MLSPLRFYLSILQVMLLLFLNYSVVSVDIVRSSIKDFFFLYSVMEGLNLTLFFFFSLLLNFQDMYILLTFKKLHVENMSEMLSFFLFFLP